MCVYNWLKVRDRLREEIKERERDNVREDMSIRERVCVCVREREIVREDMRLRERESFRLTGYDETLTPLLKVR